MAAAKTIKHRGIVLKKDALGYSSVEDRVYAHLDGEKWYASVGIGDNDDAVAYGDTMRKAIDAALDQAGRELASTIRYFTKERARLRKLRRTKP
jgi:hypothetical protein